MITAMQIGLPTLFAAIVVFGFAPRFALRLVLLAFRRDDPRRRELMAELYAVPRFQRPFWVGEQVEVALVEGLGLRLLGTAEQRFARPFTLGFEGEAVERLTLVPGAEVHLSVRDRNMPLEGAGQGFQLLPATVVRCWFGRVLLARVWRSGSREIGRSRRQVLLLGRPVHLVMPYKTAAEARVALREMKSEFVTSIDAPSAGEGHERVNMLKAAVPEPAQSAVIGSEGD